MNKCVGLELGAHPYTLLGVIPLLQLMKTYQLNISLLSGTGAGAVAASLIACGYSEKKYREAAIEFMNLNMFKKSRMLKSLFHILFTKKINLSLYDPKVLDRYLSHYFDGVNLEALKIPLIIKATDPITSKEVVLEQGKLVEALRASCALFPAFPAVKTHGRLLVSGTYSDWHARIRSQLETMDAVLSVSLSSTSLSNSSSNMEQLYSFFQRSFQILSYTDNDSSKRIQLDLNIPFSYSDIGAHEEAIICSLAQDYFKSHSQLMNLLRSVQ